MNLQKIKELPGGVLRRLAWPLFRALPIRKNRVAVVSYYGKGYSDNPKYIVEQLLASPEGKQLDICWMTAKGVDAALPAGVKEVRFGSLSYVYHMSTAKIWIDNARKYYCVKKKGQYYMQTWHGTFGLKKIEADAADALPAGYLRMAQRDAAMTDVMLSNAATLTKLYRDAFWYPDGEILENGLPRNDLLFRENTALQREVRRALALPDGCRVCLYAPTFRKNGTLTAYDMDYAALAKALEARFGGTWVVLLRLHPNVFKLADHLPIDGKTVFNASRWPDIQSLYTVSDVTITDYSSVMFDFMQTGKPVLLYASDMEDYRRDRDFFLPPEELPFPLAQNNEELRRLIAAFDPAAEKQKVDAFIAKHGFCDKGDAAKTAAAWILNKCRE